MSEAVLVLVDQGSAEEALAFLTAIVGASDDAIFSTDARGAITSWNGGAERLYGRPAFDALGHHVTMLVPEERLAEEHLWLDHVIAGQRVPRHDTVHRRADGSAVHVAVTMAAIEDTAHRVVGASLVAVDISDRVLAERALAQSEARFRALTEHGRDLVCVVDEGMSIRYVNSASARILGFQPHTLVDQPLLDFVHEADRGTVRVALAHAYAGATAEAEVRFRHDDGSLRELSVVVTNLLHDSYVRGIVLTAHNVTAEHRAAEALRSAYERERHAADRLRELDRLKDEFLSTVSHELRTPLTAISGFGSYLLRQRGRLRSAVEVDLLRRILRNSDEMLRLVESLLDLTHLEAGASRFDPRPVRVLDVVVDCLERIGVDRDDRRIELEISDGLEVFADPHAIRRILTNLITNAEKFAPPGTRIGIRARLAGDEVEISVDDEGPGVPIEDRERIFERFFRGHQERPGIRGAGVGLAVVLRYAQVQGGRVWVEDRLGGGAVFSFTLPSARE